MGRNVLLAERPLQQPANNREVATLIVRRENNGILVLGGAHLADSNRIKEPTKQSPTKNPNGKERLETIRGGCCLTDGAPERIRRSVFRNHVIDELYIITSISTEESLVRYCLLL